MLICSDETNKMLMKNEGKNVKYEEYAEFLTKKYLNWLFNLKKQLKN